LGLLAVQALEQRAQP